MPLVFFGVSQNKRDILWLQGTLQAPMEGLLVHREVTSLAAKEPKAALHYVMLC